MISLCLFSSITNACPIGDILESMELPLEIETSHELRAELAKLTGGTYYRDYLYRLIDELNPFFKTDQMLTAEHTYWAKQLLDSGKLKNFTSALSYVKINRNSMIPEFEGRYLVAKELSKLDPALLKSGWNTVHEIKLVVTHDNVTTYWEHLKGQPVRGHEAGITWDSIPGAGSPEGLTELVIALQKNPDGKWAIPTGNHGSKNLVIHEFGHTLDRVVGTYFTGKPYSQNPSFYQAWHSDYQLGKIKEHYFLQPENNYAVALEESFAEGLSKLYGIDNIQSTYDWPYMSAYFYDQFKKSIQEQNQGYK
ncbi:putative zinc metalloprotease [Vibrio cholerae HC-49A2]|nr:putative zinc metalloprotease [Vibrio cholerae HC-49A2]EHH99817.1 putative zinc metalloprotease [Vibrio cholerae HC-43A1]EJH40369.1 putative zinc metalloprotease [Vibrio cholerae CP1042(15)]